MSKILIVDDDAMMLRMAGFILKKKGYETVTALSGGEALNVIGSDRIDLVFLDVEMPGMNGLQTLETLRGQPETAGLPVCLMSETVDETIQTQAETLHAVGVIMKPLNPEQMLGIAASV